MKRILLLFTVIIQTCAYVFSQGDACNSAYSFGNLPAPNGCGAPLNPGVGATVVHNGTNVGGTAANPYTYIPDCGAGTTDMAAPAIDVWYSFVATANSLILNLTGTLATPNVGIYTGTCNNLTAVGCVIGNAGGTITNATFEPMITGQTYYIQVSGNTAAATGNFTLTLNNNNDCSDCLQQATLTVDPLPVAGTYGPGQTVNFCYTVYSYNQVSSNWLHGIQIQTSGWASMTPSASDAPGTNSGPNGCDGDGAWMYLAAGDADIPAGFGPGFYYESTAGCLPMCDTDDPEDNFGDFNAQNCDLTFCWTLTTPAVCTPGTTFSVIVNTSGDGESGSWTNAACADDPATTFDAVAACCQPPTMSMTAVTCFGSTDGTATATIPAGAGPYDYYWYNSGGVEIANTMNSASLSNTITGLVAGTYTVLIVDNTGCPAGGNIEVIQNPSSTVTVPANISICENGTVAATAFVSNPAGGTFTWTNDNTSIGLAASGNGQIGSFTALNPGATPITATITVVPTVAGCAGVPSSYTITVNPAPTVSIAATPDATICVGESVPLTGTYVPQPTTSAVTFQNASSNTIGVCTSGCDITDFTTQSVTSSGITPTALIPGQLVSICFTIRHECFDEIRADAQGEVILTIGGVTYTNKNPSTQVPTAVYNADLAAIVNSWAGLTCTNNSPVVVTECMPASFLAMLQASGINPNTTWTLGVIDGATGAMTGQILDLTVVINDYQQFTYAWSPTGTLTGTTSGTTTGGALNVTATPVANQTYTLNVTDENGCLGTNSINIAVVAAPTATIGGSASYCSATLPTTGVTIPVTLTGTPNWTIVYDTDGNLATLGDQVTVSGITTSPYNITNATAGVYQLVSVTDQGCSGGTVSGTYTVTENPTPTVNDPADILVCPTQTIDPADFVSVPAGATFGWTNSNTANGLAASGSGQITPYAAPANASGAVQSGNIVVTPTLNGCVGLTQTFVIAVNPTPTMNDPADIVVCPTNSINPDNFVSVPAGATFDWTNSNTAVGLVASGSGDIATYSAPVNGTGVAFVSTVTVTPTLNTCAGPAQTFTITVNPTPTVNDPADVTVCSEGTVDPADFVSVPAGATFNWTNTNVAIGLAAAGSGQINYTAPTNTTGSPFVGDVTVTPVLNSCSGPSQTFTITINSAPTVLDPADQAHCANTSSTLVDFTGNNPTTTYNWTNTNTAIGLAASGSGDILPFTLTNGTAAPIVATITVTPVLNGCTGTPQSFTITVNPIPVITLTPTDPTVCNGTDGSILVSGTGTGNVVWTGPTSGNNPAAVLNYTIPTLGSGTYDVYFVDGTTMCQSATVQTTLNNPGAPIINNPGNQTVCDNYVLPVITGTSLTAGVSYYTGPGGTGTALSAGANITTTQLLYIYDSNGACSNEVSFTVTVNNTPVITNPGPQVACDSYALPVITGTNLSGSQAYYNNSQAMLGTAIAGPITTTQTVWIYDAEGTCSDEESFLVTINQTPVITNPGAQVACDSYTLGAISGTNLTGGQAYYNNSQAMSGTVIAGPITTTQTVWIYDAEGTCSDEESFVVTINNTPSFTNPGPQVACDSYALPAITGTNLPGNETYYNNSQFFSGTPIVGPITSTQTVWIYGNEGTCSDEESFVVTINITPTFTVAGVSPTTCNGTDGSVTISGLNNSTSYGVSYEDDGTPVSTTLMSNASGQIVISGLNAGTYDNFALTLNACTGTSATVVVLTNPGAPTVNDPGDQTVCDSYVLPVITGSNLTGNQAYYNNSQAMGGTVISGTLTTSQTVFIYDVNGACSSEVSFVLTVNNTPSLSNPGAQTECDSYALPVITGTNLSGTQAYYNNSQAMGGTVIAGPITSTQTVWIYDAEGTCSDEESFVVTINMTPSINNPGAQVACDSYALPAITGTNLSGSQAYYNNSQAMGGTVIAGPITTTQTVWIYDANGACEDEESFTVTINNTPVLNNPGAQTVCDNYSLPAITGTNLSGSESYYDDSQAMGGVVISGPITSTQTVWIYDAEGTCSDEESFLITINPTPSITNPGDQVVCDSYTLPAITGTGLSGSEAYYNNSQAMGGTVIAGPITTTQTVWIYDSNGTCSDEESFVVTVNNTPVITNPGPQVACGSYTLGAITGTNLTGSEAYYNNSQALGGTVISGTISSSQTVWIYDEEGACSDEESFTVTINPLPTVASVTGGGTYCAGDAVSPIMVAVTGSANWSINYTLDGVAQTAVTGSTSPISLGNAPGVYSVMSISDANCSNTATGTQTIVVNPIPAPPTASDDSTYCTSWDFVDVTVSGTGGTYTWYSDAATTNAIGSGASLAPQETAGTYVYYVTETVAGCESAPDSVIITVENCEIIIPSAFTPDGDNVNDDWEIVDLDAVYPNNQVTVYNRWGAMLYQSKKGAYSSDPWDGTYNGEALPVGSYYYIVDFDNDKDDPRKGIVSIILR